MPKYALHSNGGRPRDKVECHHEWPDDCFAQSGDMKRYQDFARKHGREPHDKRFFFEAFPRNPNTWLRGEGDTFQQAEDACWKSWQKILACPGHEFDRRGRDDGYAFCKHCPLHGMFLEPLTRCAVCGKTDCYAVVNVNGQEQNYCRECWWNMPPELWSESRRHWDSEGIKTLAELDKRLEDIEKFDRLWSWREWTEAKLAEPGK